MTGKVAPMYTPKDPSYLQARGIRLGELTLPPEQLALVQSLSAQLHARVLNFTVTLISGESFRQLSIVVAVETTAERTRLHAPKTQQVVGDTLAPSLVQSGFASEGTLPEIAVGFAALEDIELAIAIAAIHPDLMALAKAQPEHIWTLSSNGATQQTLFFHREADVTTERMNAVRSTVLAALKERDVFDLFGAHSLTFLSFDSRERFEREYGGSFHLYYQ